MVLSVSYDFIPIHVAALLSAGWKSPTKRAGIQLSVRGRGNGNNNVHRFQLQTINELHTTSLQIKQNIWIAAIYF